MSLHNEEAAKTIISYTVVTIISVILSTWLYSWGLQIACKYNPLPMPSICQAAK